MPLLWLYLIRNYLQVFFLTVTAFIAILLTSRLEEIAHFTSFGADLKLIILFTILQIPYILPIAIPVACLIASILLMQKLSVDHELTAIRSAGFSLKEIVAPLIITSIFFSLANFFIISEVATLSHLKTNQLKSELRSINPLLLLHNKHLMRLKGIYHDILGSSKMGQSATDVIVALPHHEHLDLLLINRLDIAEENLFTKNLALISSLNMDTFSSQLNPTKFSNMLLETVNESSAKIGDFSLLAQKVKHSFAADHLSLSLLLLNIQEAQAELLTDLSHEEKKSRQQSIHLAYSEIARRLSASMAPFSLTLLGLAFGMSINRLPKPYTLLFPIGLTALYLICFFAAKALGFQVVLAYILYLTPHLLIVSASLWKMNRISLGISA